MITDYKQNIYSLKEKCDNYFGDLRGKVSGMVGTGAGIEMDEEKLTQAARRYRTLVRAFNITRGMRRKDDRPPENHWKHRFPELEEELLNAYYKLRGWNDDGIPTAIYLRKLGLDYVAEEFIKRGILSEAENGDLAEEPAKNEKNKAEDQKHEG